MRVVLAEDQAMVLGAFASVLELEEDVEVVATAADGGKALEAVRDPPDILITDIEKPVMSGLDVSKRIAVEGISTRVLIVTTFASLDTCAGPWT